jgi:hypothetical protein
MAAEFHPTTPKDADQRLRPTRCGKGVSRSVTADLSGVTVQMPGGVRESSGRCEGFAAAPGRVGHREEATVLVQTLRMCGGGSCRWNFRRPAASHGEAQFGGGVVLVAPEEAEYRADLGSVPGERRVAHRGPSRAHSPCPSIVSAAARAD